MVYGCYCDWGYSGPDCVLKLCPKGDDPETVSTNFRSIVITTGIAGGNAASALSGTFTFWFLGHTVTFNGNARDSSGADYSSSAGTSVGSVRACFLRAAPRLLQRPRCVCVYACSAVMCQWAPFALPFLLPALVWCILLCS